MDFLSSPLAGDGMSISTLNAFEPTNLDELATDGSSIDWFRVDHVATMVVPLDPVNATVEEFQLTTAAVAANGSDDRPFWSLPWRVGLASALTLIMVAAIVGNLLVIVVVLRNRCMRTRTNLFLCSLAVSDLLCAVVDMPFSLVTLATGRWIFNDTVCKLNGFANPFLFVVSIHTLMYIAVHKNLSIVSPMRHSLGVRAIVAMIAAAWLWGAVVGALTVGPLTNVTHKPGATQCGPDYPTDAPSYGHFGLVVATCYVLPLGVIAVCYAQTFGAIRRHGERLRSTTTQCPDLIYRQQRHIAVTLLLVVVAFIVTWTPWVFYAFYVVFSAGARVHAPPLINPLTYLFGYLNSVCNPIIYAQRSEAFREGYMQVFCKASKKRIVENTDRSPYTPGLDDHIVYQQQVIGIFESNDVRFTIHPCSPPHDVQFYVAGNDEEATVRAADQSSGSAVDVVASSSEVKTLQHHELGNGDEHQDSVEDRQPRPGYPDDDRRRSRHSIGGVDVGTAADDRGPKPQDGAPSNDPHRYNLAPPSVTRNYSAASPTLSPLAEGRVTRLAMTLPRLTVPPSASTVDALSSSKTLGKATSESNVLSAAAAASTQQQPAFGWSRRSKTSSSIGLFSRLLMLSTRRHRRRHPHLPVDPDDASCTPRSSSGSLTADGTASKRVSRDDGEASTDAAAAHPGLGHRLDRIRHHRDEEEGGGKSSTMLRRATSTRPMICRFPSVEKLDSQVEDLLPVSRHRTATELPSAFSRWGGRRTSTKFGRKLNELRQSQQPLPPQQLNLDAEAGVGNDHPHHLAALEDGCERTASSDELRGV